MVPRREWLILFLVAIKSANALEEIKDGRSVIEMQQRADEVVHDSIEQSNKPPTHTTLTSCDKTNDGQPSVDHEKDYGYHDKQEDSHTSESGPSCGRLEAEIDQNLAGHQDQHADIISKSEEMRKLFEFFEQNEKGLEQFGHEAGGKSISTVLAELKQIRQDIDGFFESQVRRWGASDSQVSEKKSESEIGRRLPELAYESAEKDVGFNSAVQTQEQFHHGFALPGSARSHLIMGKLSQVKILERESPSRDVSGAITNEVESQEALQSESHEDSLEVSYQRLMGKRFNQLDKTLHSITFPKLDNIKSSEAERNPIRKVKLGFEKSLFQAIEFMNEFGLIGDGAFEGFLANPRTHELIGNHLIDLFHVIKHGTYNHPLSFVPDMELLCKHWKTAHLHKILNTLKKSEKGHVIYTSLIANLHLYKKTVGRQIRTPSSHRIRKNFLKGNVLTELKNWQQMNSDLKSHNNVEKSELTEHGKNILTFFQNPVARAQHSAVYQYIFQTEYYLNYYILSFIETYYGEYLAGIVNERYEHENLMKQLKLFKEGIKAYQLIKQGYIYKESIEGENRSCDSIPMDTSETQLVIKKQEFDSTCDSYQKLSGQFEILSKQFDYLKEWFNSRSVSGGIIQIFSRKCAQTWGEVMHIEAMRVDSMRRFDQDIDKEMERCPLSTINAFQRNFPLNCVSFQEVTH